MRRVSSRQRLVSWDAFDATEHDENHECSSDEFSFASCRSDDDNDQQQQPSQSSSLRRCGSEDSSHLKRKRSSRRKQEPAAAASIVKAALAASAPTPSSPDAAATTTTTSTMTSTFSSTSSLISAYEWELPSDALINKMPTAAGAASLSALNDDVQLRILEFCDTSIVRNMMQVNHRYRNLIASHEAMALWKEVCHRQWPWLATAESSKTEDLVDSFHLPTVAVTEQPALHHQLPLSGNSSDDTHAEMANLALLLSLAAEHKATAIDESAFAPNSNRLRPVLRPRPLLHNPTATVELKLLQVPATNSQDEGDETATTTAVQFTGAVGQGDRCIRADQPLPRPALLSKARGGAQPPASPACPKHRSLLQRLSRFKHSSSRRKQLQQEKRLQKQLQQELSTQPVWRPFVAPFTGKSEPAAGEDARARRRQVHLTPRLVSYFEVTILGNPNDGESTASSSTANHRHFDFQAHVTNDAVPGTAAAAECVAIGLATDDFSLHTRMPGWDRYSYGYHGDDGGIFHGHGNMVREYGPRFGVGDTVGCGIDYVKGAIFFTLNGKHLGNAFEDLSLTELQHDFYPVVGMDTHCPVTCNFGCQRPFKFDLNAMIGQQRTVILQSMQ